MKKPLEKTKKPLEKPKKPLENPKSRNLAANTSYPPYPKVGGWVGGWSEVPIQKMVIGVGKSVNLPPLGGRRKIKKLGGGTKKLRINPNV